MRRALATLSSLAALLAPGSAQAWCRTRTVTQSDPTRCVSGGVALSWPTRCVSLSLDTRAAPPGMTLASLRAQLTNVVTAWSAVRCEAGSPAIDLSLGPDTADGASYLQGGPNTNAVVFVREWRATGLASSALAVTTLTYSASTGVVRDADILVNLTLPLGAGEGGGANDLPTILLHEAGHVLGLDHSDDRDAVMWFSAGDGERRRALSDDDRSAMCAVHPPSLTRACELEAPPGGCACAASRPLRGSMTALSAAALIALRRRRFCPSGRARRRVLA